MEWITEEAEEVDEKPQPGDAPLLEIRKAGPELDRKRMINDTKHWIVDMNDALRKEEWDRKECKKRHELDREESKEEREALDRLELQNCRKLMKKFQSLRKRD